jgi:tripartite-type tricarboxylate transporter receptor subunit TctC
MRTLTALLCIGLASLALARAEAQGYPNRPVRIIIPFAPGGVADVSTRIAAEKLGEKLGQRFFVENVPGAGGIAAARAAMAGGADGYTLTLLTNGTAISVPLFKSLPFDPFKDFTPVSGLGSFDCLFVTNADSEFRTLADVIKAAREKPGALNVGTVAVGSSQHLAAELFKSTAGVNYVIVPFRTSPEELVALLRGDLQMVVDFPPPVTGGLRDGKLRALATSGPERFPAFPDVPTVQESGVPGYEVTSWNAIYAPAGTPKEVVDVVGETLRGILAQPDVKKRMLELGMNPRPSTPAETEARMRSDIKKWAGVIERAGIPRQ